ncbi:preprotein translocase subunit SecA [Aurantibacillus circumpalustris]|uniref:preprotein translocase subunit SecA n=1 Tax=Aurantibacillus circumpalustris TaxID=3036359 RepID=UPI00295B6F44|nr:preprotein translocase subunit SecA [Aurantibacillus circumpalustris]
MFDFLKKLFGTKSEKDIKNLESKVEEINSIFASLNSISDNDLRAKSAALKASIKEAIKPQNDKILEIKMRIDNDVDMDVNTKEGLYKEIDDIEKEITEELGTILTSHLPEAFAVLKETARRFKDNKELSVTANEFDKDLSKTHKNVEIKGETANYKNTWLAAGTEITWDMVHYDVQLIGGMVLHDGKIAEMTTGEGKTLVSTLPIFLNALGGRGVHVVTVNNYLAKRDSEWNAPLFQFHGLSVDCIDKHEPNTDERRKAYNCDVTYGTNNEFGFDYLRDNMARGVDELVQRKHNYAIVDEVDSVLIDDARTPLIISGPTPQGDKHEFIEYKPRIEKLVNVQRQYIQTCIIEAKKLMAEGKEKEAGIPLLRAYRGLPKNGALIKLLSEQGARALLQKTENHYMQDQNKEMHKIDVELYFTIEEKNNHVELSEKGIDFLTGNSDDPKFFVIPNVGDEIAEIEKGISDPKEKTAAKEVVMREFSIKSERIHTVNQLLKAYTVFEKDTEYVIDGGQVKIVDEQTGRIMDGRRYSDGLHQAIEAKENVKIEAATQTYATVTLQNYFRMYHKLAGMTGTATTEAQEFWSIYKLDVVEIPTNRPITRKDEQDLVYKTKREKYNAVIEEVEKLVAAGRPVLIGTTTVEISELLSRMLKLRGIKHNVLNAKLHAKEAEIVAEAGKSGTVTIATNMAGRGTDIKLGPGVKEAGGLAIIGTERHESRRVDRQLRGRAGRQGDPGSSQFFASLEDNLMRLFGSERIASLMDRMGLKEGEVIQHSMITKSIERAQKKVEENNFGIRKRLIEYDDVMNAQREVIYKRRRNALYGDKLSIDIANMIYEVADAIVIEYQPINDYEGFTLECIKNFGIESPFNEQQFKSGKEDDLIHQLFEVAQKRYLEKAHQISEQALPVVRDVYKNPNNNFENIVTPFTDGIKVLQVMVNLKKAFESNGRELFLGFEKAVVLAMIDDSWKEHLRELDDLKQAVQNASLEQKDPLVIYKLESFNLFKEMINKANKEVISFLMKGGLPNENNNQPQARFTQEAPQQKKEKLVETRDEHAIEEQNAQQKPKSQPIRVEAKIGRNDPCPCGSGKKYKACHGAGIA